MEEVPRKEESMWELGLTQLTPLPPDDRELKKAQKVNTVDIRTDAGKETVRILLTYFSSFTRLQRAVAWMNRFKQYLRWKIKGDKSEVQKGGLIVEELVIAELEVVKLVQKELYGEELRALINHSGFEGLCSSKSVGNLKKSHLKALCPVKIDGTLRVGGRLQRSCLPAEAKHPIILPNNHHVTRLIIEYYHTREGHCGTIHTLNATRERFWIIKGHSTVKRVLRSCIRCICRHAKGETQIMSPLPEFRLQPGKPAFSCS